MCCTRCHANRTAAPLRLTCSAVASAHDRIRHPDMAPGWWEAINLALHFYAEQQERAAHIGRHFERAREWGVAEDTARRHQAEKHSSASSVRPVLQMALPKVCGAASSRPLRMPTASSA